ncbi:hypothetical protein [Enterococcus mediterraneensis]|jgi:hypothetical protein|uniref:hypothetical protein n=1 Tax=Enterococcus mediterraneensis TaxID=2364791 RepID=UPI000F04845F|nr:hypothetical protein [Enterococcus mediterraneensis]
MCFGKAADRSEKLLFSYFDFCWHIFHANSVFLVRFDGVLEWFFTISRGTEVVVSNLIEKGDGVGS